MKEIIRATHITTTVTKNVSIVETMKTRQYIGKEGDDGAEQLAGFGRGMETDVSVRRPCLPPIFQCYPS